MREEDLFKAWQSQPTEISPASVEQLRAKADSFQKRMRRGFVIECVAGAVGLLGFGAVICFFPNPWVKVGSFLNILALFFILYGFRKRWDSRVAAPEQWGTQVLEFHKQALIRWRDMLRSSWVWYISPVVPGMLVYWLGMMQANPENPFNMIGVVISFGTFFAIGLLNEWRARRVQREIDALDSYG